MSLADDLRAAKALIDTPEKWGKGAYVSSRGCLCILGAGKKVTGEIDGGLRFSGALWAAIPREWRTKNPDAAWAFQFNDDPATTHADVMAMFDRAIAAAEQSEAAS